MKITISGYGRMGKEVEKTALAKDHTIFAKIDKPEDWDRFGEAISESDMVIDFSLPEVAIDNINRCFLLGVPIVTGTTGWFGQLEEVVKNCSKNEGTLFYAPNFSIGVNLFFHMNKKLARIMSSFPDYRATLNEIHHIHKLDAPSGTAIKAADDIILNHEEINEWINRPASGNGILPIISKREGEVPGTHIVCYESEADLIELKHEAKNRIGFAQGAVLAAEWTVGKKGVYTMDDMLNEIL